MNRTLDKTSEFFKYVLLTVSVLYVIAYLLTVFFRIQYPFELQWQEGSLVDHVARIISGKKLYVKPTLEFIPYLYTPLYFYISAAVSKVTGPGFFPMRLVSFISSLGCFYFIFCIVKRETKSVFPAVLAVGLFAATYRAVNTWFDLARVDSLSLLLLLAGFYILKSNDSIKCWVLSGLLISLSFLTKQTALVISLPLMLYCIIINWRSAVFFIITIVGIIGASSLVLDYVHDGWYNYYVFELPRTTPFSMSQFIDFWPKDIKRPLSVAVIISICYLLAQLMKADRKNLFFYFFVAAGMVGGAWFSRLHLGSNENVLIVAYTAIAILFGLGVNELISNINEMSIDKQSILKIFIYLVCILQFTSGGLRYNPFQFVPDGDDLKAGKKFIDTLVQIKGDVFIPSVGYLPSIAGKNTYAHKGALVDVLSTKDRPQMRADLLNEIKKAIREKRFSAIILDSKEPWHPPELEKYYIRKGLVFDEEDVFVPVAGWKTRPEMIYVLRGESEIK